MLGGSSTTEKYKSVISSSINDNGSLNGWVDEPSLPVVLERFGAVTITRSGSDFIYIVGGLSNGTYRNSVYHSSVPPTPTPTHTPTATATPTPPPVVITTMENNPTHWIAPGAEVTYTIRYAVNASADVNDVRISSLVPENVELIPNSITVEGSGTYSITGTSPGDQIEWHWDQMAALESDKVSFRVRRPFAAPPSVPRALTIRKSGPATAAAGEAINYTLTLENHVPVAINDITVYDVLPSGAIYQSGGDGPPVEGQLEWVIDSLPGDSTTTLSLAVTADTTIVNSNYGAGAANGVTAKGTDVVVTVVDGTPLPPYGDGVSIVAEGVSVSWFHNGTVASAGGNSVRNPQFVVFMPLMSSE